MAENKIYAVLTDRGAQLEAAALASGVPVVLNKFVIGDANGNDDVTPDPARTALIHETYRGDIKSSENSGNQVIFTLYVPPETGGYTIREVGILTDKGELYSVARSPDILKPTDSNGALISITYKYTLAVSSTSTVNVVIDNSSGMSQADADKRYLQIRKNLSEIKDKGAAAQKTARENIGVNLDDYYTKKDVDNLIDDSDDLAPVVPAFAAVGSVVYAGFGFSNETVMHYKPGDTIAGSLIFPAYIYRKNAQLISDVIISIGFSAESLPGLWALSGYMPSSSEPTDGNAEAIFTASFATNFIRVA
ncbi:TPA: phage tail protein [Escherichia coli]|uniref:phage tail protein n=1 Tax=Enterobacteriaceae TaxID=543 RepID=UPI001CBB511C|nr:MULTISPECIES: phage tail protein [Enterobacteriaceae]MCQ9590904.1 phage tail protein [Escherichia coli]MCV5721801.1 phage tail protein [Escherichia coli]MDF0899359.1 phage tail protein [Escherichia coli]MDQ9471885.1 phage tail protein [Escherichia coli]MDY3804854.1 phage tail protein [Escherichia coli]